MSKACLVLKATIGQSSASRVAAHALQNAEQLLPHAPIPDGVRAAHTASQLPKQGPRVHIGQLLCQGGREEAGQGPCCCAVGRRGEGTWKHTHQPGEGPDCQHGMVVLGSLQFIESL